MIRWSEEKNQYLKTVRQLSFEPVALRIDSGHFHLIDHPTRTNQKICLIRLYDYIHAVPCVIRDDEVWLKTMFPSRYYHKIYSDSLKPHD